MIICKKPNTDYSTYDTSVINLGLNGEDMNYTLLKYIDSDVLSKLPLEGFQIDIHSDKLNWDIMSSKYLPGWIFSKYKNRINWKVFLINGYPKELEYLLDVKDKIEENSDIFFMCQVKKGYYTTAFMNAMPEFVDWCWCGKNIQLTDQILLKYWDKIKSNIISKYQKMSENVIRKKYHQINWCYAGKRHMSEKLMGNISDYLNWGVICKWQKLSSKFIEKYKSLCTKREVSRYQKLAGWFIAKYNIWLNMEIVSQYQDMSIDFIRENIDLLSMEHLEKNNNYNKIDTIQIFNKESRWYIIDAPIVKTYRPIKAIFCHSDNIIDST
jgi:hypothetical protein